MADTPPLHAVPDPDDPESVGPTSVDGTSADPDDLAFVVAQLAGMDHLRPDDAPLASSTIASSTIDVGPMPPDTWARLQASLRAEAAAPAPARGSRTARWAGGLVAASVAVVAIGIAATVLRSGGGAAVVAESAADTAAGQAAKMSAPSASAFAAADAAPPSGVADAVPAPSSTAGAAEAAVADAAPAARAVLDSRTEYRPDELPGQVVSLVKQAGFSTLREAVDKQMPTPAMPVDDGFTASWDQLRDCITWLTHSAQAQALVVDRGTYAGVEAGVVVAPAVLTVPVAASGSALPSAVDAATSPSPTASFDTPVGVFDVWVVDPQCEQVAASLDDFALYDWRP